MQYLDTWMAPAPAPPIAPTIRRSSIIPPAPISLASLQSGTTDRFFSHSETWALETRKLCCHQETLVSPGNPGVTRKPWCHQERVAVGSAPQCVHWSALVRARSCSAVVGLLAGLPARPPQIILDFSLQLKKGN